MYIASKAGNLQERKKDKGVKGMNQEKRRKFKLFFYCIGVIISIFALYAFIFVAELATGWEIFWSIIGLGWLISAISGILENLGKK